MNVANRHYWLKSGSYNLVLNIQGLLFGFGGFYLLVRLLDKHSFGIWALFVTITTVFEVARNGLIQNALIRFLSSHTDEHPKILTASFFLSGALMLACIIINMSIAGYLASLWHYPGLVPMFYAYNLVYVLQGILSQFQWIEQANLSFRGILVTGIIRQGGFFAYILFCFVLHTSLSLMSLIYVQAIAAFVSMVIEYFFIKQYLFFSSKVYMDWVKKLFNYGKYVFGSSMGNIIISTVNQMMLGTLLSPDAAGAFNVAVKITNLTDIPTNAIGVIVFPQNAQRFSKQGNEASKYMYEKSVGTILALLVPSLAFLFIFPGFVVHLVAGGKYAETIPIIQVTVLYCLFTPFSKMFGIILDTIGKPKVNFVITILFTITELVLNYIMIKRYGIIGSAYATLIACIFFFTVMQIILRRELRVNFFNTFIYAKRFYPEFFHEYIKPFLKRAGIFK
jgi:lipopolysaccharide exporter